MTCGPRTKLIVDVRVGCEYVACAALLRVIREHPESKDCGVVTPEGYEFMVRQTKSGWSIRQTDGGTSEN